MAGISNSIIKALIKMHHIIFQNLQENYHHFPLMMRKKIKRIIMSMIVIQEDLGMEQLKTHINI